MSDDVTELAWLIQKAGYFYRPDKRGYTTQKHQAGRYTEVDARAEARVEPWHMQAIHEDEVPDDESVEIPRHKAVIEAQAKQIADLRAQLAACKQDTARRISDRDGIDWFEKSFGVPIGDMPGRLDVERMRAAIEAEIPGAKLAEDQPAGGTE